MLAKQGKLVQDSNKWSGSILGKIDVPSLKAMYSRINAEARRWQMKMSEERAKRKGLSKTGGGKFVTKDGKRVFVPSTKGGRYEGDAYWPEAVMGRSTFTVNDNKFVLRLLEGTKRHFDSRAWEDGYRYNKKLDTYTGKEAMITDDFNKSPGKFYDFIKDLDFIPAKYMKEFGVKNVITIKKRKRRQEAAKKAFEEDVRNSKLTNKEKRDILDELVERTEDFILTNDIHDMVTFDLIAPYINSNRTILTDAVIKGIHKKADEIKNNSYLAEKQKTDVNDFYKDHDYATPELKEGFAEVDRVHKKAMGKKAEPGASRKMDQAEIDIEISNYKKTLKTAQEKKLFDYFMLGSYSRAKREDMLGYRKTSIPSLMEAEKKKWYQSHGAKTSMIKLGFNSEAIPSQSIRAFLKKYLELSGKAFNLSEPEVAKVVEIAKTLPEKTIDINDMMPEQTVKFQDVQVPFVEQKVPKEAKGTYVEDLGVYDGIYKQKLPKDQRDVIAELAENLSYYSNKETINLNEITAGILGKPLNEMDKSDYISLNKFFKDLRRGSLWQRIFGEDTPDMRARYHMLFPKSVDKEMMKYDVLWLKKKGWFKVKGKEVFGTTVKPSWWISSIQDWISRMSEKSIDLGDRLKMEIGTNLSFYVENIENGEILREFAIRKMERKIGHAILTERRSLRDPQQKKMLAGEYENRYQDLWKNKEVQEALNKEYSLTNPKGEREKGVSGSEIVSRISEIYKNMNRKIFEEVIAGKPDALLEYYKKDKHGDIEYFDVDPGEKGLEPKVNWKRFIKDMTNAYKEDGDIPTHFGIDGLKQIARSMNIDLTIERLDRLEERYESAKKKKSKDRTIDDNNIIKTFHQKSEDANKLLLHLEHTRITKTDSYDFGTYFPHLFHSKKEAMKSLERQIKFIETSTTLTDAQKESERRKLIYKMHTLTGDWVDTYGDNFESYDKLAEEVFHKRAGDKINWTDLDMKNKNMMSR